MVVMLGRELVVMLGREMVVMLGWELGQLAATVAE